MNKPRPTYTPSPALVATVANVLTNLQQIPVKEVQSTAKAIKAMQTGKD